MVRKLFGLRVAVGLLVVVAAAAVLAPAAFAHTSDMSVTAVCNTATGQWDLTWKVGPTSNLSDTPKVTASNRTAIPVNTFLTTQNTTFTESVAGSTSSVSAAITITWIDDNTVQHESASKTLTGGCVQDTGSLKITKALTGGPQGYTGPFDVAYNCGVGHTGTTSVSVGSPKTISGIPLLTTCTVSEPVLPSPPSGYSFGTPTFSPNNGVVTVTSKTTPVEVTVNNTLTRDKGYLKIGKVFDAKSSGFVGSFTVKYNCGAGDQSVQLAAGGSTTVGPFDTGTSCSVSEPVLPSAPSGWTFGTPVVTGSPATIVKGNEAAAVTVTVTNSISHDQGYLKIGKVFDAKSSGFVGSFTVKYNCGAGDQSVQLAAGGSTTVGPFDTGTSCSVSEPVLPSAPSGWTFGTPVVTGSPATIVKGNEAAAVTVTVTNSISHDQGYLKIGKVFDAKSSGFVGSFTVKYNCGAGDQSVQLAAGGSTTVGPFDTGTSCSVSEPVLPSAPSGWTFGTPVVTGSPATIVKGNEAAAVTVTVTNSISHDQGYLKIGKVFDAKSSGFVGSFTVKYNCGAGDQSVQLAAGGSTTVGPFDTGTSCSVSEPVLPSAPSGWTFGTPVVTGSPATIAKSSEGTPGVTVTVTNSITQNPPSPPSPPPPAPKADVTVTKAATPAVQLPLGGGTMPIVYDIVAKNNGPDAAQSVKVSDTAPTGVTFVSATTAKGSCAVAADSLSLQCTIGSLTLNESVAITINATVNSTGTKVNTVTITTTTTETNTGNNSATASTVVTSPATPPTPKPKPKPAVCKTLIAAPKTLKATGKKQVVKVMVKTGSKPTAGIKVKISGAGIIKTVTTGRNGTAVLTIKPGKPGLLEVTVTNAKACSGKRIGIVGVFEPPLTG